MELTKEILLDWHAEAQGLFWQTKNEKRIVQLIEVLEPLLPDKKIESLPPPQPTFYRY